MERVKALKIERVEAETCGGHFHTPYTIYTPPLVENDRVCILLFNLATLARYISTCTAREDRYISCITCHSTVCVYLGYKSTIEVHVSTESSEGPVFIGPYNSRHDRYLFSTASSKLLSLS